MSILNIDDYINNLPLECNQYKMEIQTEFKSFAKNLLELAAENVGFIETTSDKLNSLDYMPFITADDNTIWTFDKQSILDTINQIK